MAQSPGFSSHARPKIYSPIVCGFGCLMMVGLSMLASLAYTMGWSDDEDILYSVLIVASMLFFLCIVVGCCLVVRDIRVRQQWQSDASGSAPPSFYAEQRTPSPVPASLQPPTVQRPPPQNVNAASAMRFCGYCGAGNPPQANHCGTCGSALR
jgi:hypothetical protein